MERLSEALRTLFWEQGKKYKLSPIQIQVLVFLHQHPRISPGVTQLASEFNMTKATMSDSIVSLSKKGLILKSKGHMDQRSKQINLTIKGHTLAGKLSEGLLFLEKAINSNTDQLKQKTLLTLLKTIEHLVTERVISPQRMCFSCRHYSNQNLPFCNFLNKKLREADLQIDCPEHESIP